MAAVCVFVFWCFGFGLNWFLLEVLEFGSAEFAVLVLKDFLVHLFFRWRGFVFPVQV